MLALSVCLLLGPVSSASAWSNGVNGPNTYGTHDWILHKAVRAMGPRARWVRLRVALRAMDDLS